MQTKTLPTQPAIAPPVNVQPANKVLPFPTAKPAIAKKLAALALAVTAVSMTVSAQVAGTYKVTNLVSDGSVPATITDAGFINPWGVSASGTWWISAQGSGQNYVVGSATPTVLNFKVVVPAASGVVTATGLPAGSVTTAGTTGMLLPNGTKAAFLFSTLDGTISGWNSKLGTAGAIAQVAINNAAAGASYPGLAIINTATASFILAPNFGTGNAIEVYDGTFAKTTLPGAFKDPNLPAGYSPFSVHVLGAKVYVAYALRSATAPFRSVDAIGNGVVSVFDTSGNFVARVATGGNLDSPWGVAIAPANFGIFGGSLLIGNFGNGLINAFDPVTFAYRGQLSDGTGKPLTYASLWELLPGGTAVGNTTSVSGGDTSTVYFSAGLTAEAHGLFAAISNDTTAGTPSYGLSSSTPAATVTAGASVQATINVAPTFNFNGTISLACAGLPVAATCSFSPAQITASASAPVATTVTIQTAKNTAQLEPHLHGTHVTGILMTLLLPFGSLLSFFRLRSPNNRTPLRLLIVFGAMLVPLAAITGCSTYSAPPTPYTPPGTSQVTVTATSGTITQSTVIALTVQ